MLKIKLARSGPRNKPFYRIVAIDHRKKLTAPPLENIGYWNPLKDKIVVDKAELEKFLKLGARVSRGVAKILTNEKPT